MENAWLVSVPAWGQKYRDTFRLQALPALRAAIPDSWVSSGKIRLLIHTDAPGEMLKAALNLGLLFTETREISQKSTYVALQEAHQEAVRSAAIGERIALLNADLVVSSNLFTSCESHIQSGKQAIVLVGIRTDPGKDNTPVGMPSRQLLQWAWQHRHQIIKDLEWGAGSSMLPTNLFFSNKDSVVCRGFHLHPVAIHKTKKIDFQSTIDGDLLDQFPYSDVHVVVDPDDMSMLEISDPGRRFPIRQGLMTPPTVAGAMRKRASPMHCWLFTHRIVIQGDGGGVADEKVATNILELMGPNTRFGGPTKSRTIGQSS